MALSKCGMLTREKNVLLWKDMLDMSVVCASVRIAGGWPRVAAMIGPSNCGMPGQGDYTIRSITSTMWPIWRSMPTEDVSPLAAG